MHPGFWRRASRTIGRIIARKGVLWRRAACTGAVAYRYPAAVRGMRTLCPATAAASQAGPVKGTPSCVR